MNHPPSSTPLFNSNDSELYLVRNAILVHLMLSNRLYPNLFLGYVIYHKL
jgi:hypothetical protein